MVYPGFVKNATGLITKPTVQHTLQKSKNGMQHIVQNPNQKSKPANGEKIIKPRCPLNRKHGEMLSLRAINESMWDYLNQLDRSLTTVSAVVYRRMVDGNL